MTRPPIRKPVAVTLETDLPTYSKVEVLARFDTLAEAEAYLGGPAIDQQRLAAGHYGIDAPEEMVNP